MTGTFWDVLGYHLLIVLGFTVGVVLGVLASRGRQQRQARVAYDARLRLAEELGAGQRRHVVDLEFRPKRGGHDHG